jgi:hypothetical protein
VARAWSRICPVRRRSGRWPAPGQHGPRAAGLERHVGPGEPGWRRIQVGGRRRPHARIGGSRPSSGTNGCLRPCSRRPGSLRLRACPPGWLRTRACPPGWLRARACPRETRRRLLRCYLGRRASVRLDCISRCCVRRARRDAALPFGHASRAGLTAGDLTGLDVRDDRDGLRVRQARQERGRGRPGQGERAACRGSARHQACPARTVFPVSLPCGILTAGVRARVLSEWSRAPVIGGGWGWHATKIQARLSSVHKEPWCVYTTSAVAWARGPGRAPGKPAAGSLIRLTGSRMRNSKMSDPRAIFEQTSKSYWTSGRI